jgi:hypothetical protein
MVAFARALTFWMRPCFVFFTNDLLCSMVVSQTARREAARSAEETCTSRRRGSAGGGKGANGV